MMEKLLKMYVAGLWLLTACGNVDDTEESTDGNWVRRSSFEGEGRSNAIAFVIDDKAYVGLGYDGDEYLTDLWSYDANQDFWQRKADFPGVGRTGAVAFTMDGIGYVATGYDGENELQDVWSYDPSMDTWTQMNDFGGGARYQAVAFSLTNGSYIGTGYNGSHLKDFWRYNEGEDSWEQAVSLRGEKRRSGMSFVIHDKAYVGTGINNGIFENDFWQFDISSGWTALEDLDEDDENLPRAGAVSLVIDGIGYVATGLFNGYTSSTWSYTPLGATWNEMTSFEGVSRDGAISFTVGGRGFVGLGQNGSQRFDDFWEFKPLEAYDDED